MPIYEYECATCGKRFDKAMTMAEHGQLKAGQPKCPDCGKPAKQLVSDFSCKAPSKY